jgi:hypothetical protein
LASDFEKDLDKFSKKLENFLDLATSVNSVKDYAKIARDQVVKRTTTGRGVAYSGQLGGNPVKFKGLHPSYIREREHYADVIRFAKGAPNKSSLTFTGEMLASVNAMVRKNGKGKVEILIQPTGVRADGISNKQLAEWHATGKGNLPKRAFLGLTRLDLTKVNKTYAETFSEIVGKVFK